MMRARSDNLEELGEVVEFNLKKCRDNPNVLYGGPRPMEERSQYAYCIFEEKPTSDI